MKIDKKVIVIFNKKIFEKMLIFYILYIVFCLYILYNNKAVTYGSR